MNIPTSREETLDRMSEIVRTVCFSSRDTNHIRDLISLANHPDIREGMGKRRRMLERYLDRLAGLSQRAAVDRCWADIHSVVSDFSSEIAVARTRF